MYPHFGYNTNRFGYTLFFLKIDFCNPLKTELQHENNFYHRRVSGFRQGHRKIISKEWLESHRHYAYT